MKPLLMEIKKRTERLGYDNLHRGFEAEHPDLVSLFDSSIWYVKTLGIKGFERGGYKFNALEFTKYGLYIEKEIFQGKFKGKSGFIAGENQGKYIFYPSDKKEITHKEFQNLQQKLLDKDDLSKFSCIQLEFNQIRRTEAIQSQQGIQQVPWMKNSIKFKGFCWNLFEIASYRQQIKDENLDLLENFISELTTIKEELLYYTNYFDNKENLNFSNNQNTTYSNNQNKYSKEDIDMTMFLGPFKGFYELFKPLMPQFNLPQRKEQPISSSKAHKHKKIKIDNIDDVWKLYSIYKKTHGLMQY
ncbi:MAG: hypothetical protein ACOCP8_09835, partial [archaeon]